MRNKKTAKIVVFICLPAILLAILIPSVYTYCKANNINANNFFFTPINIEEVSEAAIITGNHFTKYIGESDLTFSDQDSLKKIIDIEDFVRKTDGVYKIRKCTVWTVEFVYTMKDGSTKSRIYKGQCDSDVIIEKLIDLAGV